MLEIAIIDEGFESRFSAFVSVFAAFPSAVIYTYREGNYLYWNKRMEDWEPTTTPPHCLLFLIHGGEDYYRDKFSADKRIWFGGFRGRDSRIPIEEEKIYRSIESAKEVVKDFEAESLVQYAKGKGKKPAILLPPSHDEKINNIITLIKTLLQEVPLSLDKLRPNIVFLSEHAQNPADPKKLEEEIQQLIRHQSNRKIYINKISKLRDSLLHSCGIAY